MYPYISLQLSSQTIPLHTNSVFIFAFIIFSGIFLVTLWKEKLELPKIFFLMAINFTLAVLGSRLMHCFWEAPTYYLNNPGQILTSFQGMTFYGGLLFCLPFSYLYVYGQKHLNDHQKSRMIYDLLILLSMGYGVLRLGCFANGCCWGKLTGVPWAVVYNHPQSVMPVLGLPVHPVQFYDSLLGFLLAVILLYFQKTKLRLVRDAFIPFFIVYGLGRFVTEFFRGDDFRGLFYQSQISTSQMISLFLIALGAYRLVRMLKEKPKRVQYV